MLYKYCSKCKKLLAVTEFHKAGKKTDGYCDCCKSCANQRAKRYYEKRKSAR